MNNRIPAQADANAAVERAYQALIDKYPGNCLTGYACLKLGDLYLAKKEPSVAVTYFEMFLKTADPDDSRIAGIKEQIEKLGGIGK